MVFSLSAYTALVWFSCILLVWGQVDHQVQVGASGSFFTPPTISAQLNDTVTFVFVGERHEVAQGTFDDPCTPLKGGFNSGLSGTGGNASALIPSWTLTITNVSEPIWFFCEAVQPASHCASGMVGVINPPSIDMYNDFVASAKLVTGTPAPTPTVILTGQGAFATNSPSPTTTPVPSTSSSSSSSSSTSSTITLPTSSESPSPTATLPSSSSHSNRSAIIGGSVGGVAGLALFLLLVWLYVRHERNRAETNAFFRYSVPPTTRMFQSPRPAGLHAASSGSSALAMLRAPDMTQYNDAGSGSGGSSNTAPTAALSPVRRQPSRDGFGTYTTAGSSTLTGTHPFALDTKALNRTYSVEDTIYSAAPSTSVPPSSHAPYAFPSPPPLNVSEKEKEHEREKREYSEAAGYQQPHSYIKHAVEGSNTNLNSLTRDALLDDGSRQGYNGGDSGDGYGPNTPPPPPHYRLG